MPSHPQKPCGHKLRLGRFSETGRIYLLTTVTAGRQPVFANLRLGRIVVCSMRYQHQCGLLDSMAFVVMHDHLHWLIQLGPTQTLPGLMRRFKGLTSLAVNRAREHSGSSLWQAGYHDHAVRREEDVQPLARYVIGNPLRAGLVDNVGDYPLWDAIWL